MANIQSQFEQYHEAIRTDYDTNKELRDKRDIILGKIEKSLAEAGHPSFERIMQGSYIMRTGVKPVGEKEYDIDVGLKFRIEPTAHSADEVRKWVLSAIEDHTDNVVAKGPCVRVGYAKGFHVDLVAYAWWLDERDVWQFRLAHGTNGWLPSDPPRLLDFVQAAQQAFADTEGGTQTSQLRRVIRYLKRWDDVQQPEESDAKPSGLAFTLLSIAQVSKTVTWDGKPDDRTALVNFLKRMTPFGRLTAIKPSPEFEDVFGKLDTTAMAALASRFGTMREALEASEREPDPSKACALLVPIFGEDFPVPTPDKTGTKTNAPAIITSSASA